MRCIRAICGAKPYSGQGCHSDGSSHVVGEVEEGCTVGDHARVVQSNSIGNGSHAVLTHTEPQVLLLILVLLEVTVHLHQGHVGGRQVCRTQGSAKQWFCIILIVTIVIIIKKLCYSKLGPS